MKLTRRLFATRAKITPTLKDAAAAGTSVGVMGGSFLVACPEAGCARVTLRESGKAAVHVDACVDPPVSQRVYLSVGGALPSRPGQYAVCASRGPDGGISPAALPVVVLERPFTFNAVNDTNTSVTIHVSGGDLAWREEPYIVCAVPSDESCESAVAGAHLCVTSASAREPSVMMDLTDTGLTIDNSRFCLVAANVTFLGRTHTWVTALEKLEVSEAEAGQFAFGRIIGIILGILFFLVVVVFLAVCVPRRRRRRRRRCASVDDAENPSPSASSAVAKPVSPVGNRFLDDVPPALQYTINSTQHAGSLVDEEDAPLCTYIFTAVEYFADDDQSCEDVAWEDKSHRWEGSRQDAEECMDGADGFQQQGGEEHSDSGSDLPNEESIKRAFAEWKARQLRVREWIVEQQRLCQEELDGPNDVELSSSELCVF